MKYASMLSPRLDTSDEMIFLLHNIWRMGFQKKNIEISRKERIIYHVKTGENYIYGYYYN